MKQGKEKHGTSVAEINFRSQIVLVDMSVQLLLGVGGTLSQEVGPLNNVVLVEAIGKKKWDLLHLRKMAEQDPNRQNMIDGLLKWSLD